MASEVYTYRPNQVSVTCNGVAITGFAENSFIKVTRNGDLFESIKGADGTVDRVYKASTDFTVELTLKQTSPANLLLQGYVTLDAASNAGIFVFNVTDSSGNSTFTAPQAWVSKDPDEEYGNGVGDRTWTMKTGNGCIKVTGGN